MQAYICKYLDDWFYWTFRNCELRFIAECLRAQHEYVSWRLSGKPFVASLIHVANPNRDSYALSKETRTQR
jgi:hypothetical protein